MQQAMSIKFMTSPAESLDANQLHHPVIIRSI